MSDLNRNDDTTQLHPIGDPDVLVVGGGIAGLGAALRLRDHGLRPLVLEAGPRVGGRMTTARVGGFAIDRGATLLGRGYPRMIQLARRLGLGPDMRNTPLSVAFQDADGLRLYRVG